MKIQVTSSFVHLGRRVPVGSIVVVHDKYKGWEKWGVEYYGPYPPKRKMKIELKDLKS